MRSLSRLRLSNPSSSRWKRLNPLKPAVSESALFYSSIPSERAAEKKSAPLQGLRVLDMTRVLAGPFCTMLLGDLGAEIIKIEKPDVGDDTRSWGPPWVGQESAYFVSINRNKQSVTVNLKKKEGLKIIHELAARSDILVENYVPGVLDKMGLGYQELSQINPRLVYASITGFGSTGPYVKRGGYDMIAAALGGLMHITGPKEGEPCRVGVALTDLTTGLYCKGAILAALLHRYQTGKGQHVEANLVNTQVSVLTHIASNWLNCGVEAQRLGTSHPSLVPYQAFRTKKSDEYIIVGAGNNYQFQELCQRMDLPEISTAPKFKDNGLRVTNREALSDILQNRFREKSLSEWLNQFEGVSFAYGPINSLSQVFSDPQVIHNDIIKELDHSTAGKIKVLGPAVSYSGSDVIARTAPPTLGEHTEHVLTHVLNYDSDKIKQLREDGAI